MVLVNTEGFESLPWPLLVSDSDSEAVHPSFFSGRGPVGRFPSTTSRVSRTSWQQIP